MSIPGYKRLFKFLFVCLTKGHKQHETGFIEAAHSVGRHRIAICNRCGVCFGPIFDTWHEA